MQPMPFLHKCPGSTREITINQNATLNRKLSLVFTIPRMKMRWGMIAKVHRDNDAEEAAKLGHPLTPPSPAP